MTSEVAEKLEKCQITENGAPAKEENKDGDIVTPWEVHTTSDEGINYMKLIGKYF